MRKWLKNVMVLASAFALMLAFRTLAFSIHSVSGNGLTPLYRNGDCLLVNRCSYGLRIVCCAVLSNAVMSLPLLCPMILLLGFILPVVKQYLAIPLIHTKE